MQRHTYNGAIKYHYRTAHDRKPTAGQLVTNTKVLHRANSKQRLTIDEEVNIALKRPHLMCTVNLITFYRHANAETLERNRRRTLIGLGGRAILGVIPSEYAVYQFFRRIILKARLCPKINLIY